MYDTLIKYFNGYSSKPLTGDEIEIIQRSFAPKKFRKRQYFLQEGEVCKYTAFIIKGAMRQYRVDEKGEGHIIKLFIENWWASDRESLMKKTPSIYFIDAWEETEALLVTKTDLADLVDHLPALAEWIRKLDTNFAAASQRRISAAISLSAEERYHDLEETYPEFMQRFPQHIIASYLGINRETLSRIRSRGIKK
ncbi:MAG TPA: Crp/Fnr family transcriptional regulator [Chitinophagaceae bacterium]|nr:Crp/Fnr family transcriptional regulator [Chitinophagaceae bacterium]